MGEAEVLCHGNGVGSKSNWAGWANDGPPPHLGLTLAHCFSYSHGPFGWRKFLRRDCEFRGMRLLTVLFGLEI